jgi:hypothetical protein
MHRGYTKRWRKRWDKDYCKDHLLWVMMSYFIDHANYCDCDVFIPGVGVIHLKRGQHVFSTTKLSMKLGVDRQRIRTKLKILKNMNFLTIKPTNQFSIATVINYNIYQPSEKETNQQTNQQLTSDQPAPNQQLTTDNKDNKDNKEKETREKTRARARGNGQREWPSDFCLTDGMKTYAIGKGIDPDKVDAFFLDFRDWAISKGALYKNWDAAFRTRVNKAAEYGRQFLKSETDKIRSFDPKWREKISITQ